MMELRLEKQQQQILVAPSDHLPLSEEASWFIFFLNYLVLAKYIGDVLEDNKDAIAYARPYMCMQGTEYQPIDKWGGK